MTGCLGQGLVVPRLVNRRRHRRGYDASYEVIERLASVIHSVDLGPGACLVLRLRQELDEVEA